MAQDDPKVVVIGFGDREGGDAAVGLEIVSELQRVEGLKCELRIIEGEPSSGFLDDLPPHSLVIFIDSVEGQSRLGTLHCLKLPSSSVQLVHLGAPDSGRLREEIDRLQQQKVAVPRLFLIGVEIGHAETGKESSQEVRKAAHDIVRNFARYLKLARDLTA